MRIFVLIVLSALFFGCSLNSPGHNFWTQIQGYVNRGDSLGAYNLSKDAVKKCTDFASEECLLYVHTFWYIGKRILEDVYFDGQYEQIEQYAEEYLSINDLIRTRAGGNEAINSRIMRSKNPILVSVREKDEAIQEFVGTGHIMLASYFAFINDPARVDYHLDQLKEVKPELASKVLTKFDSLKTINSNPQMRNLFEAIKILRLSIQNMAYMTTHLYPVYAKISVTPNSSPEETLLDLKANIYLIQDQLFSDDTFMKIYVALIQEEEVEAISKVLNTNPVFEDKFKNTLKCSFVNLITKVILQAKGFKASLMITSDSSILEKLFGASDNHAVCLIEFTDGRAAFVDGVNNLVSDLFNLNERYYRAPNGYIEQFSFVQEGDLYKHFMIVPDDSLLSISYLVLGGSIGMLSPDLAFTYLKKSSKIWPNNYNAYIYFSILASKARKPGKESKEYFEKEVALYRKALNIYPKAPDAYEGLCRIYQEQEKFQESYEACAQWIELFDHSPTAYKLQGLNEVALKKYQQAHQHISKAKEIYIEKKDYENATEMDRLLGNFKQ